MGEALIVADLQKGITERFAFAAVAAHGAGKAVAEARRRGMPVIFVHAALRPDGSDVGERNPLFRVFLESGDMLHDGTASIDPDPVLGIGEGDLVVTKRRTSAFVGSDLEIVLRAQGATSIVLCGAATSAVVAATAYDAADRDLGVTILSDACGDPDAEAHAFFVERVFPSRMFTVQTVAEWEAAPTS